MSQYCVICDRLLLRVAQYALSNTQGLAPLSVLQKLCETKSWVKTVNELNTKI